MGKKELLRKINSKYIDIGDKIQQLNDTWDKLSYMVTEIREATAIDIVDQIGAVCDSKMLTEFDSKLRDIKETLLNVSEPDDPIYLDMQKRVCEKISVLDKLRMNLMNLGICVKAQYPRLSKEHRNLLSDCVRLIAGDNSIPLLQKHITDALSLVE